MIEQKNSRVKVLKALVSRENQPRMMGHHAGVQHKKYPCQLSFWEGIDKQSLGGCKQILRERNRVAKGYRERLLENRGHFGKGKLV
jgi:hypothetical protein